MQLTRSGLPGTRAPEAGFTGDVQIGGTFRRASPSRLSGGIVTFPPGARTPWKVNPLGQTLIVTAGAGWAQAEGGPVVEISAGDMLWFPPGQRHWEGATPGGALIYVAIQEGGVEFGEKVTDAEYAKGPQAA